MPTKVNSCLVIGIEGHHIEVEADILPGLPGFTIVGLGDASVQESKERIRSAIKKTSLSYPTQKKIINLAPASLRKQGPSFDLPIAIALLAASGKINTASFTNSVFCGELGLDGTLRPIKNTLTIADFAQKNGFHKLYIPDLNYTEASLIRGIEIVPIGTLSQLIDHLNDNTKIIPRPNQARQQPLSELSFDFSLIQGQQLAKRALQISAAAGHHLLFVGSPGIGKTLLAKALSEILPPLNQSEALEVVRIYSAANKTRQNNFNLEKRPFRQVHHSSSMTSLLGGTGSLIPGEISLAHRGILFLDEIAEFPKKNLDALRQPLEEKQIHLSKNNLTCTFPAAFTLVAAMNLCPCGYYGDPEIKCSCTQQEILSYQKKLSGPVFDRIDLSVKLDRHRLDLSKLTNAYLSEMGQQSELNNLRSAIQIAREIQKHRYQNSSIKLNSDLDSKHARHFLRLDSKADDYLAKIHQKINFSPRSTIHLLKIARTLADLNQQNKVTAEHLAEAMQFRKPTLRELV